MPRKPGRPAIEFTVEMLDEAKRLLGRVVFSSRAVGQLCKRFDLSRDVAYRLLATARQEALDGLVQAGHASDPAGAAVLLFLSIMSDRKLAARDRVAAGVGLTRLLGTCRRVETATTEGEVDQFLGELLAKQLARKAAAAHPEKP